jgi:methionine-gamma-lyase
VPDDVQRKMGLSEGLVRYSVGLDNDIERSWLKIEGSLKKVGVLK